MRHLGSPQVSAALRQQILALYDAELPYHNAGHGVVVRDRAVRLAAQLTAAGQRVDALQVELAALFHDAGYRHAPSGSSREAYAAELAEAVLCGAGYSAELVTAVRGCILGTEFDATPETLEERIVRAADLLGMGGTHEDFAADSALLRAEARVMSGCAPSDEQWRNGAEQVIGGYVDRDAARFELLRFLGVAEAGGWAGRARENLRRLVEELT